jgi:uncharacterized protein (TIGR02646 family)
MIHLQIGMSLKPILNLNYINTYGVHNKDFAFTVNNKCLNLSKKKTEYKIRSHIEHIRPRSRPQYAHLIFCYRNLSVSSEGFFCKTEILNPKKEFCEHRKGNEYDEDKFLNPVERNDIEDYFVYDIEGKIHPNSSKNQEDRTKAEYMISILDLNHSKLIDIRKEQYQLIIEQQENGLDIEEFLNPHYDLLPAFYAMLKQLFL